MKITQQQIKEGLDEIIIRYVEKTPEIERIISLLEDMPKIIGNKNNKQYFIDPQEVIYIESVDGSTFLYTQDDVYKISETLNMMEVSYSVYGFFRCSKSMIINIYRIHSLKSIVGSRIDAQMDNHEHVIISRRYAKELRMILKGETL